MNAAPSEISVERALRRSNELLEALGRIHTDYLTRHDVRDAFESILSRILSLTESEYGFIGEILGPPEARYLRTYAATNIAWDEPTRRFYEEGKAKGLEFRNMRTLFGAAILSGEPVIANDPATDPRRGGLPSGHPALRTFLGLPFRVAGEVCGMIGIANRPGGYDQALIAELAPVVQTCSSLMVALRDRNELETTTSRLAALIQNLSAGLLVEDERRTIRLVNPHLMKMFGIPGNMEDLLGQDCASAAVGLSQCFEDPAAFLAGVDRALSARELERATEWTLRDGRTLERDYIPIFIEGSYRGHLWNYRDVTTRKEGERILREQSAELSSANRELARALRTKDEFLAAMSHELRTPLVSILGLSESLSEQLHGPLNERQASYVRTIEESGRHLLDLINDVLDIAKVDASEAPLQLAEIDLAVLSKESLRLVREVSVRKKQRVSLAMTPAEITCVADPRRLKQMLVNLLSNAVKFTGEHGHVSLDIEADEEAGTLVFSVKDTGVGISTEHFERIFLPFTQVERDAPRESQGTGLGLAITKKLAELHGGRIRVESEPEKGSTFEVSMPWRRKVPARRESSANQQQVVIVPQPAPVPAGPLVLLAEDNAASATAVADYLIAHGFRVELASNGEEAVERARDLKPEAILMDIQMPVLDGREATRRIRCLGESGATVPILALTALAMPGDRDACLEAGADDYLTKPLVLRDLVQRLEEVLAARRDTEPP